jgi:hypothetical protein
MEFGNVMFEMNWLSRLCIIDTASIEWNTNNSRTNREWCEWNRGSWGNMFETNRRETWGNMFEMSLASRIYIAVGRQYKP